MRTNIRSIIKLPALVYAFGLGALFLADLLISSNFLENDIADWARFRSLVGIAAIIPLIGLDQVLVRNPKASAQLLRLIVIQLPLLSLMVGVALKTMDLVSSWWLGTGLAIGSATSLVLFQYFRTHHWFLLSQLSQQGWKIAVCSAIIAIVLSGWRGDLVTLGVSLLLAVNLVMALGVLLLPPSKFHIQQTEAARTHYAIGSRFMVSGLMLALSVYAEQLIVNQLGSKQDAALYFASAVYFLFIPTFFNGYMAFLMGPWIRDKHDRFQTLLRDHWIKIVLGTLIYALILNLVGWTAWQVIRPSAGEVDFGLQLLFFFIAAARSLYLLPSGYLGIFGMPREHNLFILLQIAAVVPVVGLFFVLRLSDLDLIHSVAAASALNWSIKTLVGYKLIDIIAAQRKKKVS